MRVTLTKKKIDSIFRDAKNQYEVFTRLYKATIPNWDNVSKIQDWPIVNNKTGSYIFQKFIEFDSTYHPDVISGGLWLNSGFTLDNSRNLKDWKVFIPKKAVIYKGGNYEKYKSKRLSSC